MHDSDITRTMNYAEHLSAFIYNSRIPIQNEVTELGEEISASATRFLDAFKLFTETEIRPIFKGTA